MGLIITLHFAVTVLQPQPQEPQSQFIRCLVSGHYQNLDSLSGRSIRLVIKGQSLSFTCCINPSISLSFFYHLKLGIIVFTLQGYYEIK